MEKVAVCKSGVKPAYDELRLAIEALILPFGGIGKYVKPGDKVLLKPNAGFAVPPGTGKVTDPNLVRAVSEIVLSVGASEVWIAESSIIGTDTSKAFEVIGYDIFGGMEKVRLIDLKKEKALSIDVPGASCMKRLFVFERVFMADVIINLPKMKTIASSVMSMGMKNLKGLIRDDSKKECHYGNLHEAVVDINRIVKPDLTIIDGLIGCSLFEPIEHGILLAGEDIVALDTVGALCAGIDPKTVKYLCIAEKAGLGTMDQGNIQVIGERPEAVMKEYRKAKDDVSAVSALYPEIAVSAGGACTGCVTVLEAAMKDGKAGGWLKSWESRLRFALGPNAELPDDELLTLCLGNCMKSRGVENIITGCPYLMVEVKDWLEKRSK